MKKSAPYHWPWEVCPCCMWCSFGTIILLPGHSYFFKAPNPHWQGIQYTIRMHCCRSHAHYEHNERRPVCGQLCKESVQHAEQSTTISYISRFVMCKPNRTDVSFRFCNETQYTGSYYYSHVSSTISFGNAGLIRFMDSTSYQDCSWNRDAPDQPFCDKVTYRKWSLVRPLSYFSIILTDPRLFHTPIVLIREAILGRGTD